MNQTIKRFICLTLLIITVSLGTVTLTACNSGKWIYVTYYYNDEMLEQEKYWQYAWSFHGDKHKDDADWDKDRGQVMTTVKRLVKKLYTERGKKVFFVAKQLLDGEMPYSSYWAYSYTYGECRYNRVTNSMETFYNWHNSLAILYNESHDNYILVAKDEP